MSRLAISLSWIGGYTNVVAVLATGHVVSHVTGNTTQLGIGIGMGDFQMAKFFAFLVGSFTLGAALSALMTESAKRRGWRSKYILPIGLEGLLLALLCFLLQNFGSTKSGLVLYEAAGLASLAMGLQNATITKISGAVIRTTHLTGIFTDLGLEGVQFLFWWGDKLSTLRWERAGRLLKVSRRHPTALRLLLLLSVAGSFGFGVVAGTLAFSHWAGLSLLAPIAFLAWIVLVDWRSPIADVRELDLLNDPELGLQGILSTLLPDAVALYRAVYAHGAKAHRAPNFQSWVDRVPDRCRVLVLAVSPLTRFDANAVLDLQATVDRLHRAERKLVLAGITAHQYKALDALGVGRVMDMNNICPDVEFAIARSMSLLEDMKSGTERQRPLSRANNRSMFGVNEPPV